MAPAIQQGLGRTEPGKSTTGQVSRRGCPICGGTTCEVLHTQNFVLPEGHPLAEGYQVVACRHCGFVYADTRVGQRDYDIFYARFSKYEDSRTSSGGGGSPEDRQRLRATAACLARTFPDRQSRLLDVGCANGGLLEALRDQGFTRLCGLDPSSACIQATKELCGAEGFVGSLSAETSAMGEFDGVILSHVLEHVQDLGTALRTLGRLTRSRGLVYAEVPDASRYAECLVAPFQDFNTEHINHFSTQCLANLFLSQGWAQQESGRKTMSAGPAMPYPATYGVFAKLGGGAQDRPIVRDLELHQRVLDYIAASRQMMARIDERLRQVLADGPEVIIWGTGQLAMKLLSETCLAEARIAAFVDGNPVNQGKVLRGRPILAPSQAKGLPQPIIITSILHSRAIVQLIRQQLNLPNRIVLLES
jgi:SAM-dependent methyltransferase